MTLGAQVTLLRNPQQPLEASVVLGSTLPGQAPPAGGGGDDPPTGDSDMHVGLTPPGDTTQLWYKTDGSSSSTQFTWDDYELYYFDRNRVKWLSVRSFPLVWGWTSTAAVGDFLQVGGPGGAVGSDNLGFTYGFDFTIVGAEVVFGGGGATPTAFNVDIEANGSGIFNHNATNANTGATAHGKDVDANGDTLLAAKVAFVQGNSPASGTFILHSRRRGQ